MPSQGHINIISILCNPGLKQRHWDQMSELCGFDVTPDTGTSLRKLLKMGLEPYLEKYDK
jgi:dynein heavy chain